MFAVRYDTFHLENSDATCSRSFDRIAAMHNLQAMLCICRKVPLEDVGVAAHSVSSS